MDKTIESLEKKREYLYGELQETGDFRRGIISVVYRKCGKKNCACAKEGHPGHGPVHLWNTTIKGEELCQEYKAWSGDAKVFGRDCKPSEVCETL